MTIQEYLVGVKRIYYQMSTIVKGKQIVASGRTHRLTDIFDTIRFSTLSLPAATEIKPGTGRAVIDFGGVHLVIWPVEENTNA